MNNSSVAGGTRRSRSAVENWIRERLRWNRSTRWGGEARRSSELSRHAETKTDGEFTPALCAWIIHALRIIARVNRGCPIIERIISRPTERDRWRCEVKKNGGRNKKRRAEKGRLKSVGRTGIKYYSRISVLTPLLRDISPWCLTFDERRWKRWHSDVVKYLFAIVTTMD